MPTARPVHVLQLQGDLRFGGDETRCLSFARTADRDRIRTTVVTVAPPDSRPHPELRPHYEAAGIDVLSLGGDDGGALATLTDRSSGPGARVAAVAAGARKAARVLRTLTALVRDLDVDVIDAHGEVPTFLGVCAGRRTRRPVAVTAYHLESREASRMAWMAGQVSWGGADALISDSYFATDLMRRWTLHQPRRLEVIRNGVRRPANGASRAEARARLGVPTDEAVTVIGQVSRLHPLKGHRYAVEALPAILERHPDTWMAFVGFPEHAAYPDELRRRARELGVDHRMAIGSWAGDIADVWPGIDVQVHASELESLPIAIAEGMSLEKPAVVTAVAGTEEEVAHGETGLVVPPADAPALAAALLRLLDDPAWAAELGRAAGRRYEQMFLPADVTRQMEDLFVEMAGHAGRG